MSWPDAALVVCVGWLLLGGGFLMGWCARGRNRRRAGRFWPQIDNSVAARVRRIVSGRI